MTRASVAEHIADWIRRTAGVAFLVGGAQIDAMVDAAAARGVRLVPTASEYGAAAAADAWSRRTGGVGVCLTIGGPGLAMAAPALAVARNDGHRVVVITGDVPTALSGRGGFQDGWDDAAVGERATGRSRRVTSSDDLGDVLAWVDKETEAGRSAHVAVPHDVQRARIETAVPSSSVRFHSARPARSPGPHLPPIARSVVVVAAPDPPVDLDVLRRFAERGGRVLLTVDALGVVDRDLAAAVVDPAGDVRLAELVAGGERPEHVVVLGGRLGERTLGVPPDLLSTDSELVHVDAHPDGACCTDQPSWCHAEADVTAWLDAVPGRAPHVPAEVPLGPVDEVVEALVPVLAGDGVLVVDAGRARSAVARAWRPSAPGRVLSATGLGPMGWSLGAAVGAAEAGDSPVMVLVGDGAALLASGELRTIAASGADIRVVLLADGGHSTVRRRLAEPSARATTALAEGVDWVAVGDALGLRGHHAADVAAMAAAASEPGPSLIVVRPVAPADDVPRTSRPGWDR